jgi:putative acetyltransferase
MRQALALGARRVDVNEQNPQALGFYRRFGFEVVSRDAVDGLGLPYPILHCALPE